MQSIKSILQDAEIVARGLKAEDVFNHLAVGMGAVDEIVEYVTSRGGEDSHLGIPERRIAKLSEWLGLQK